MPAHKVTGPASRLELAGVVIHPLSVRLLHLASEFLVLELVLDDHLVVARDHPVDKNDAQNNAQEGQPTKYMKPPAVGLPDWSLA